MSQSQYDFIAIKQIIVNGTDLHKLVIGNQTKWLKTTVYTSNGGQIIGNSNYTSDGTPYVPYDSAIHYQQSFSMPDIRWDGGCSHGTWCDGTPVITLHYSKELGSGALSRTGSSFSCDGCHLGSGIRTARYSNAQCGGLALFDVQIDYSYFTFARTIYIPDSRLPYAYSTL